MRISEKYGLNPSMMQCFFCQKSERIALLGANRGKEASREAVYDMEPCGKCKELMTQGVLLITVRDDQAKVIEDACAAKEIPNPYRTGGWYIIKDEAIQQMIQPKKLVEQILKRRWSFIPDSAAKSLGLEINR